MGNNWETELKLTIIKPEVWESLISSPVLLAYAVPGSDSRQTLDAQYFDTPGRQLLGGKLTYRIRGEDGRWVATVKDGGKITGGLHHRREWNVIVDGPEPDPRVFRDTAIGARLQELAGEERLQPVIRTKFERRRLDLLLPGGDKIEAAVDRGEILAGEPVRRAPILEVELELKAGRAAALLAVGADLSRRFPLLLQPRSKYFRGLELAGLVPAPPAADRQSPPAGDGPAVAGWRKIIIGLIHRLTVDQDRLVSQPDNPDVLPDLWADWQSLRAALKFARPLLGGGRRENNRPGLRAWEKSLGIRPDRAELYAAGTGWTAEKLGYKDPTGGPGSWLAAERRQMAAHLRVAVRAGRLTPLLLDLWTYLSQEPAADGPEVSFTKFSRSRLRNRLRKMLKTGPDIDFTDDKAIRRLAAKTRNLYSVLAMMDPGIAGGFIDGLPYLKSLREQLAILPVIRRDKQSLGRRAAGPETRDGDELLKPEDRIVRQAVNDWRGLRRFGRRILKETKPK